MRSPIGPMHGWGDLASRRVRPSPLPPSRASTAGGRRVGGGRPARGRGRTGDARGRGSGPRLARRRSDRARVARGGGASCRRRAHPSRAGEGGWGPRRACGGARHAATRRRAPAGTAAAGCGALRAGAKRIGHSHHRRVMRRDERAHAWRRRGGMRWDRRSVGGALGMRRAYRAPRLGAAGGGRRAREEGQGGSLVGSGRSVHPSC